MKRKRWGSPLVQEKYREEKACDRRHAYGTIIIIISKSVETSQGGKVTILWNQKGQTDRTIHQNKPDIIIRDNEKGTYMLIDVAMSGDRNVT